MFYCDACAKQMHWPVTMFRSLGPCEWCENRLAFCNQVPTSLLPFPEEKQHVDP